MDVQQRRNGIRPGADTWRSIARSPFDALPFAPVGWTGEHVLAYDAATDSTFAYSAGTDDWSPRRDSPWNGVGQGAVSGAANAWTGDDWVLWGGARAMVTRPCELGADCAQLPDERQPLGAAFRPDNNRWLSLPSTDDGRRTGATAVWTGAEVIIWGGRDAVHAARGALGAPSRWSGLAWRPAAED